MSRVAISVFILLVDVAAITGNALVIIAFITNRKLRKPSGCYVTNLAAADLCMSLVGIPFYVATVILNKWPFGEYFCAIWTVVERVCSLVSNFAIVAICFDRYWLITQSSLYLSKHSIKSAKWRIAAIWIVAFLLRVPFVVYGMVKTWKELTPTSVCDPSSIYDIPFQVGVYEYDTIYTLIATLGEFLIPLILIVVWGVQVYFYLEKREKQRLMKAVERSRAMSLDFAFSQREIAHYRALEERRGSTQSFLSKLFSPESKLTAHPGNGKTRSQDTIAGPLSDLDEEPHEGKARTKPHRKSLENGMASHIKSEVEQLAASKISIVLNPVPAHEPTAAASNDEAGNTRKSDDLSGIRLSISQLSGKSKSSQQSLAPRKSASLNMLEVPTRSLLEGFDTTKDFPTSRSTPSIVLSCSCDHNIVVSPEGMGQDSCSTSQQFHAPEKRHSLTLQPTECIECQKESDDNPAQRLLGPRDERAKPRSNSTPGFIMTNLQDKTSLKVGSPVRKSFLRAGCASSNCDFLDVPNRSHFRLNHQGLDHQGDNPTPGNGDVNPSVLTNKEQCNDETRKSSFSSYASELPESLSSIITASEPPSPGARRPSNAESYSAEFIQRVLNSKARQRYRSYRRRALMTIVLMICVFVVFQLPYVVVSCIYSFCTTDCLSDVVYESANWWYWAKVFLNPFLYAHISSEFRRYSCAILRCKLHEKQKRHR